MVAAWGFIVGDGESILSIIPVNTEDNILHLLIGLSGLAAGLATAEARTAAPAGPAKRPDPGGRKGAPGHCPGARSADGDAGPLVPGL